MKRYLKDFNQFKINENQKIFSKYGVDDVDNIEDMVDELLFTYEYKRILEKYLKDKNLNKEKIKNYLKECETIIEYIKSLDDIKKHLDDFKKLEDDLMEDFPTIHDDLADLDY